MTPLDEAKRQAKEILRAVNPPSHASRKKPSFTHSKATDKLFKQFPLLIREQVARPAARGASTIVRKAAKKSIERTGSRSYDSRHVVNPKGQPIGRSRSTGTFKKLSNKLKSERKIESELSRSFITRNWPRKRGGDTVGSTTGPSHKRASHAHLLEYGAAIILWGGVNKEKKADYLPPRPFFRTAVDGSMSKQQAKVVSVFKKWAKKLGVPIEETPEIDS